ncbi:MAG: thiamine phosphate synthase [Lactobacillus sp.]|jgi:thiamine-phosphate pyrophosphorylase|nr:thiamine phosphate synthase [Lactobacillus sp.]MCI2031871.1 thiamine phosphate synthase [Lactobacillus sp.]
MNAADLTLYLVTNRYQDDTKTFLAKVDAACANGVTMVQLREKALSTRDYDTLALQVKTITDRYQLPLIIDDRVDICLAVDAAGVHIGDSELPVAVTRRLLGPDKLLGVSAKTVATAQAAAADGADYLGVGAIYPTQTKAHARRTSLETLIAITTAVTVPVVAIGGVKAANIASFQGSGIAGVAIVSEIMQAPDIAGKVREIRAQLKAIKGHHPSV